MTTLTFSLIETLGLSVAVLLIGQGLTRRFSFLQRFCIPAPVVGGLLFSLVALVGMNTGTFAFVFDHTLKDFFMICFFATVGFGADLQVLRSGGRSVLRFLLLTTGLVVVQNALGVGYSLLIGESPLLGLAAGSISMVGGHATANAYGPVLTKLGLSAGTELTVAAATFGLIAGSMIGGPTARRLIEKHDLTPGQTENPLDSLPAEENGRLTPSYLTSAFFQISIAVGLGSLVTRLVSLALPGVTFPAYIGAMLVAVVMRNVFTDSSPYPTRQKEISALGDIFLSIFLVQSLMVLKLWELRDLALPLLVILLIQAGVMYLWATYLTFPVMGKDYDAAVLAAGNCGFGLGATPNAMANMNAVVRRYGPSPKAFFILPIVGSLFIDVINGGILTALINILA